MWPSRSAAVAPIAAVLAMALAAPALGAEPASKPPETAAKPAKEKLVCRNEEVTGSLVRKRVCFTETQIKAQRQAVEDLNKERRELGATKTELSGMTPSGTLSGH
jgi:hypothetical protein